MAQKSGLLYVPCTATGIFSSCTVFLNLLFQGERRKEDGIENNGSVMKTEGAPRMVLSVDLLMSSPTGTELIQ